MKVKTTNGQAPIDKLPSECPFCKRKISPNIIIGSIQKHRKLDIFLSCPDVECKATFIGYYSQPGGSVTYLFSNKVSFGNLSK